MVEIIAFLVLGQNWAFFKSLRMGNALAVAVQAGQKKASPCKEEAWGRYSLKDYSSSQESEYRDLPKMTLVVLA